MDQGPRVRRSCNSRVPLLAFGGKQRTRAHFNGVDKMSAQELIDEDGDDTIEIDGQRWPLVPDGQYVAVFVHHETARMFRTRDNPDGTCKCFLHFKLIGPGEYVNMRLYRAVRVSGLIGKPAKHGRFRLRQRSDLFVEMARLFGNTRRLDRLSLKWLRPVLLRVTVRTVKRDYRQRELPQILWYSVVSSIDSIEAGNLEQ